MNGIVSVIKALKGLVSISLLGSFYTVSAIAEPINIVGDDNHPPYSYQEDGQAKGIYFEIIARALQRMPQFHADIELYPWKRALMMSQRLAADAIFPPHKFVKARPYLVAYSEPLLKETVTVFCNNASLSAEMKKGALTEDWVNAMSGAVFVISRGVKMGSDAFWRAVAQGKIKVIEVAGPSESLQMLLKGRAHCHINDQMTMEWHIHQSNEASIKQLVKLRDITSSYSYLALTAGLPTEQKNQFLAAFNRELNNMKQNGEVEKIITRYFDLGSEE